MSDYPPEVHVHVRKRPKSSVNATIKAARPAKRPGILWRWLGRARIARRCRLVYREPVRSLDKARTENNSWGAKNELYPHTNGTVRRGVAECAREAQDLANRASGR